MTGGYRPHSGSPFPASSTPQSPGVLGFPYGDTGILAGHGGWLSDLGDTSPNMSSGPDSSSNWIRATANLGTHVDSAHRTFTPEPVTTDFTLTFNHFYAPTTGAQDTIVEIDTAGLAQIGIGLDLNFSGTGAGNLKTAKLYDNASDTGFLSITLPVGQVNAIKVTYDGTNVKLYVNTVLQITWPHVIVVAPSLFTTTYINFTWATGFGEDLFMQDLQFHPGVL